MYTACVPGYEVYNAASKGKASLGEPIAVEGGGRECFFTEGGAEPFKSSSLWVHRRP